MEVLFFKISMEFLPVKATAKLARKINELRIVLNVEHAWNKIDLLKSKFNAIQQLIQARVIHAMYLFFILQLLGRRYIYTVHVNACVRVRGRPGQSWDKRRLEESGGVGWQQAWVQEGYRDLYSLIYMYSCCVWNKINYLYSWILSIP